MKKMLSIAIAAVMAFTLSMPAFAAATEGQMQNEGQLVTQIGNALASNNVAAATAAATDVVKAIKLSNSDVSKITAEHLQAVLNEAQGTPAMSGVALADGEYGAVSIVGEGNTAASVTMNNVVVTKADGANVSSITFEATATGDQSALGYTLSLTLPASALGNTDFAKGNMYLVYTDNGVSQKLDSVMGATYKGANVVITVWVPHFSTYTLEMGSAGVVQPTVGTVVNNNNNGGGNDNGGNNDNGGSTPAATPAPVAASNPIKKTGADMSVALTALAVVAGVALVGGVVAMKKSGLDQ